VSVYVFDSQYSFGFHIKKHKEWDTKSINRTTLRQYTHTQTATKTHIHSLTYTLWLQCVTEDKA